jgi:mannose-6-phosphate isomerase
VTCRDTEVLCNSLTYSQGKPQVLIGEEIQEYTKVYSPPFEEFEVFRVDLPAGASTILPANQVSEYV